MKKIVQLFCLSSAFLLLMSCQSNSNKSSGYLPNSIGNINSLQVIIENELWQGAVGDTVRNYLTEFVEGLPQVEPLFSITQLPPSTYTGFARNYRSVLHLTLGDSSFVQFKKNRYAKPQFSVILSAKSNSELIDLFKEQAQKIIDTFKYNELKERQKRTRIAMLDLDSLKHHFKLSLEIPAAYRVATASDKSYWIRKNLKEGTTNILIYRTPSNFITDSIFRVSDVIKIRDEVGSLYLPVEDGDRFITEAAYTPYLYQSKLDGKPAYEAKGTWEVEGQYMAGPYITYFIKEEKTNTFLVLEGFTYAPSTEKRDLQFELEAILKSVKFLE